MARRKEQWSLVQVSSPVKVMGPLFPKDSLPQS